MPDHSTVLAFEALDAFVKLREFYSMHLQFVAVSNALLLLINFGNLKSKQVATLVNETKIGKLAHESVFSSYFIELHLVLLLQINSSNILSNQQ